jgi:hypothetical protein
MFSTMQQFVVLVKLVKMDGGIPETPNHLTPRRPLRHFPDACSHCLHYPGRFDVRLQGRCFSIND